jgi:uncharacterized protein YodC (DUF2158 family)
MATITEGMIVELISGGPKMSVGKVSDYSTGMMPGPKEGALCVWFDSKQNKCEEVFDTAILKEYVAPSSSTRVTRG